MDTSVELFLAIRVQKNLTWGHTDYIVVCTSTIDEAVIGVSELELASYAPDEEPHWTIIDMDQVLINCQDMGIIWVVTSCKIPTL